MPPSDRILVFLDFRTTRRSDQEINKSKRKIALFTKFARTEFGRVFKRATLFRFSTVAINSVFNSLRFAREEAVSFQKALADVIKLDLERFGSLGSASTRQLADTIGELSAQFNVTRVNAARAFQTIVTAGFRGSEALQLFETTLLAQAAAGLSATNATSLLIAIMKQFDLQVNQTEQALNILLVTQSKAAVDFSDFAGAFRTGGAALAQTTNSLNEAAAAVAALGERTRESGSVVGTFFKTLAARIVGRQATKDVFEELGIEIEVEGRLRSIVDIVRDLRERIKDMDDVRKGEVISIIAGIRQGNRFNNFLESLPRVFQLVEENAREANEARRRAELERQTIEAKLNDARIQFSRNIERVLVPAIDSGVEALRLLASSLQTVIRIAEDTFITFADPSLFTTTLKRQQSQVLDRQLKSLEDQFARFTENSRKAIDAQVSPGRAPGALPSPLSVFRRAQTQDIARIDKFFADLFPGTPLGRTIAEQEEKNARALQRAASQSEKEIVGFSGVIKELRKALELPIKERSTDAIQQGVALLEKALTDEVAAIEKRVKEGRGTPEELKKLRQSLQAINVIRSPRRTDPVPSIDVDRIFRSTEEARKFAVGVQESQIRIAQAYQQVLEPAKNFNDSLLTQRNTLAQLARARVGATRAAVQAVERQIDGIKKQIAAGKLQGSVVEEAQKLERQRDKLRAQELRENAKIAEFDANAVRRLNTRLNELRDGTRDASSRLATATRRLLDVRKQEERATANAQQALIRLGDAIVEFQAGLLASQIEARKITGEIGSFSQELKAVESSVPQLENFFSNITGREIELARLRRDSLSQQVDLIKSIISEQQRIGESFFGLDQAGRTDIFKGFSAIEQLLGRFGGNVGAFNQLSDQELNAFGRQALSLPTEIRRSIINALGFLPQGATIAGFTADQIRNIISSAALGRSSTAGVENIQDLQKRAAEATVELAKLNTDQVASSIQGVKVAERALDEAKSQTALAQIRVNLAREQLSITSSAAAEQRANIERQIAEFQRLSQFGIGAGGGSARTTAQRIAEAQGLGAPKGVPIRFEDIKGNNLREKIATIQAEQLKLLKEGKLKSTLLVGPDAARAIAELNKAGVQDTGALRRAEQVERFLNSTIKGAQPGDILGTEETRRRAQARFGPIILEGKTAEEVAKSGEKAAKALIGMQEILLKVNEEGQRLIEKLLRLNDPALNDFPNLREGEQKRITDILDQIGKFLEPGAGQRKVDVDIDVNNEVDVNLKEIADVAQVVTDTIQNIPEIRDFKSLKGGIGTVFAALVQAINSGEPVNPSVLNNLNTGGVAT